MRKLLQNYDNFYENTLLLGYMEIHQQKCDNEACAIRHVNMESDDLKRVAMEELIKKIYSDGCKMTPVNPELLLEFAIFYYELGLREKALKTLLDIKHSELALDKLYKFGSLKYIIQRQINDVPDHDFLDLLSDSQVKDFEQKIMKKFEQSALISLQFWSILNEDHPDFNKMYKIGKTRVTINQQIEFIYNKISDLAYSEKITTLYIHYLNQINNEEKMFSQVEDEMKNQQGYEDRVVIEDWSNNHNPIIIISIDQQNFGRIIDLNTSCSTLLCTQKFDLISKDVKIFFPDELQSQIDNFMDHKASLKDENNERYFYIRSMNGYSLRIQRKVQHYNSMATGVALIINFDHKYQANSSFMLFNQNNKLFAMSSSCILLLDIEDNILENNPQYSDIFNVELTQIHQDKTIMTISSLLKQQRTLKYNGSDSRALQRTFDVDRVQYTKFWVFNFQLIRSYHRENGNMLSKMDSISHTHYLQGNINEIQKNQVGTQFMFYAHCEQDFFKFTGTQNKLSMQEQQQELLKQRTRTLSADFQNVKKNYAENITTLRLEENYIKVIELESQSDSGEEELQSKTSTHNQFFKKSYSISKADEQKIFQTRKTFTQFIDHNQKPTYITTILFIAILISCGVYSGLFVVLKDNYKSISASYFRYSLGNRVIGNLAEARRLIIQSKYHAKINDSKSQNLLLENYANVIAKLQEIMKGYTDPFKITVQLTAENFQDFQSDEFILSYISELSKVYMSLKRMGSFAGYTGMDSSSVFIELNGNTSKQQMYPKVNNFKLKSANKSANSVQVMLIVNVFGVVLSGILTFLILYSLKKVDDYKIQILQIFLETTQKDIQAYTEKTQNFLVTLHADEANESNQPTSDELNEIKKNSAAMFAKKKRFKQTKFDKTSYFIMSIFFLFSSAFFMHLFAFGIQKNLFIVQAIQYFGVISEYADVYSIGQAQIYQQLLNNFNNTSSSNNNNLVYEINKNILTYQRDLFVWHYKTYGSIQSYHKDFATIYMRDICAGQIPIKYACDSGIMAQNGTLLMITDLTILNQNMDFSKIPSNQYQFTLQTIKQAHQYLLDDVLIVSTEYFNEIYASLVVVLIIWSCTLIIGGLMLQIYVQKFIMRDLRQVKKMLKFLPVSFARESQGINKFLGAIVTQK